MSIPKSGRQTSSPLLSTLQRQIMPWVQQYGMKNIVVARPTLRAMTTHGDDLPADAYLSPKPLISEKVAVISRREKDKGSSMVNARWPADGLHASKTPIIGFVTEGNVAIPFGDYVLHCKPGHGFLILPGTPYPDGSHLCIEETEEENASCSMFSIRVWRRGIACWLNHTHKGKHWSNGTLGENCHILNPKIRNYLEELKSEIVHRSPHYDDVSEGILKVMMLLVLRELQRMRTFQPVQSGRGFIEGPDDLPQSKDESIERALEYIHQNLHEPLTIEMVAAQFYMSRAHFTRQFRKVTGMTFNTYLREYRLDIAKVLLQNTEYSVDNIGEVVGVSGNHLRLLFQQNFQITPQKFRQSSRQEKLSDIVSEL